MGDPHWPLFDLRLTTDDLVLRPPTDADLPRLADLAVRGVHDPASTPFEHPWTDRDRPGLERGLYQWHWHCRANLRPAAWTVGFLVERHDGTVVGIQDLVGEAFTVRRSVATGSWLGRDHQGRGLGKQMRTAVLHLAFDHLGAEVAATGAWADNDASIGVSRSLGYEDNGERISLRRGAADRQVLMRMDRAVWSGRDRPPVDVAGAAGLRALIGLTDGDPGAPGIEH